MAQSTTSDQGIVVLDRDLRVRFVNKKARELWRLKPEQCDNWPSFAHFLYDIAATGMLRRARGQARGLRAAALHDGAIRQPRAHGCCASGRPHHSRAMHRAPLRRTHADAHRRDGSGATRRLPRAAVDARSVDRAAQPPQLPRPCRGRMGALQSLSSAVLADRVRSRQPEGDQRRARPRSRRPGDPPDRAGMQRGEALLGRGGAARRRRVRHPHAGNDGRCRAQFCRPSAHEHRRASRCCRRTRGSP